MDYQKNSTYKKFSNKLTTKLVANSKFSCSVKKSYLLNKCHKKDNRQKLHGINMDKNDSFKYIQ